jgi:predicted TIM-barrel fold metal-dependent hydrolase
MGKEMIDAHVHVWTDDRRRYPRAPGSRDYAPERFTPEDLLRWSRASGVTRAVLIQPSVYGTDHTYLMDSMRANPGVFSAVGVVDSNQQNVGRAMKQLVSQGVRGFRIVPGNSPRTWLNTAGMAAMWRLAAELRVSVCPLIDPDALAGLERMCDRFPETPVAVDHLARIGADGYIRETDAGPLCELARRRGVRVKVSAFYALGRKQPPYTDLASLIRRVFEAYGPQRLMWGSDCPFQVQAPHTYAASIGLIRERLTFLTADDREWLLSKTAERVFFAS